jgi:hypothetical protein
VRPYLKKEENTKNEISKSRYRKRKVKAGNGTMPKKKKKSYTYKLLYTPLFLPSTLGEVGSRGRHDQMRRKRS